MPAIALKAELVMAASCNKEFQQSYASARSDCCRSHDNCDPTLGTHGGQHPYIAPASPHRP